MTKAPRVSHGAFVILKHSDYRFPVKRTPVSHTISLISGWIRNLGTTIRAEPRLFIRNRIGTLRTQFRHRRKFDNKLAFKNRYHTVILLEIGRLDHSLDNSVHRRQNRSFLLHDGNIEKLLSLLDDIAFLDMNDPEISLARAGDMIRIAAFGNNRFATTTCRSDRCVNLDIARQNFGIQDLSYCRDPALVDRINTQKKHLVRLAT